MFENSHIIQEITRQRHEEQLAEMEMRRKIKSSSNVAPVRNRRLGNLMLAVADMLIVIGVGLKRRFGSLSEGPEGAVMEGSGQYPGD